MEKNITSFEEYKTEYAKSINSPEQFCEEKAAKFVERSWNEAWSKLQWKSK